MPDPQPEANRIHTHPDPHSIHTRSTYPPTHAQLSEKAAAKYLKAAGLDPKIWWAAHSPKVAPIPKPVKYSMALSESEVKKALAFKFPSTKKVADRLRAWEALSLSQLLHFVGDVEDVECLTAETTDSEAELRARLLRQWFICAVNAETQRTQKLVDVRLPVQPPLSFQPPASLPISTRASHPVITLPPPYPPPPHPHPTPSHHLSTAITTKPTPHFLTYLPSYGHRK